MTVSILGVLILTALPLEVYIEADDCRNSHIKLSDSAPMAFLVGFKFKDWL